MLRQALVVQVSKFMLISFLPPARPLIRRRSLLFRFPITDEPPPLLSSAGSPSCWRGQESTPSRSLLAAIARGRARSWERRRGRGGQSRTLSTRRLRPKPPSAFFPTRPPLPAPSLVLRRSHVDRLPPSPCKPAPFGSLLRQLPPRVAATTPTIFLTMASGPTCSFHVLEHVQETL